MTVFSRPEARAQGATVSWEHLLTKQILGTNISGVK